MEWQTVFRRATILVHIALVTALFLGSGAQWFMLQTVAWTKMVIRYSSETSMTVALEKTFNGQNPCILCKRIEKAKKEKDQQTLTTSVPDLKAVLPPGRSMPMPAAHPYLFPQFDTLAPLISHAPPVPPPKRALA